MPQIQRCAWLSPNSARLRKTGISRSIFQNHPTKGASNVRVPRQCPVTHAQQFVLGITIGSPSIWVGFNPEKMLAQTKPETVSGGVGARPILGSPFPFHLMCIPRSPTAVRRATDEVISPPAVTSTFDMPRRSGTVT